MQNKIINNIIPADDLFWDKEEKRYTSISEEETKEIVSKCVQNGMHDLSEIYKFVQWCGYIRIGQLLIKHFMLGSLKVTGFDSEDTPYFCPNKENL